MELKLALSIEQQIEKLKSDGLNIDDYNLANRELSNINYYMLSGYFYKFKNEEDKFTEGYSFEYFLNLYKFDNELKNIIYKAISVVEHTLRTKISYHLALRDPANPEIYLSDGIYSDGEYTVATMKEKIEKYSDKRKDLLFVSHHRSKYENHFPAWVAIELFSFGDICYLFKKLKPEIQKEIANEFDTRNFILMSWMNSIKYARNIIAHHGRIYGRSLPVKPKLCRKNHKQYKTYSDKIFDCLYLLKILYYDKHDWVQIIERIELLFSSSYGEQIDLQELGFPENWKQLLLN